MALTRVHLHSQETSLPTSAVIVKLAPLLPRSIRLSTPQSSHLKWFDTTDDRRTSSCVAQRETASCFNLRPIILRLSSMTLILLLTCSRVQRIALLNLVHLTLVEPRITCSRRRPLRLSSLPSNAPLHNLCRLVSKAAVAQFRRHKTLLTLLIYLAAFLILAIWDFRFKLLLCLTRVSLRREAWETPLVAWISHPQLLSGRSLFLNTLVPPLTVCLIPLSLSWQPRLSMMKQYLSEKLPCVVAIPE